jgi:phage gp45-like
VNESDLIPLIKQTIKQEIAQIMMANVITNTDQNRSTLKRFPSDSPFGNVRNIQPFGLASRAPAGTQCLLIPSAGDVTQLNMVGHFDTNRPTISDGESILYGADGQVVFMKAGGTIHQGTKAASSPVVLGDVLKTTLTNILEAILNNSEELGFDSFGLPVFLNPAIKVLLKLELDNHINDATQNILGQKNFVDRGA